MTAFPLRNDYISNSTDIGNFLKLVKLCLKIQHEYRAVSVWSVFSPEFPSRGVQIVSHDHAPHLVYSNCQYQTLVACVTLSTTSTFTCTNTILQDPVSAVMFAFQALAQLPITCSTVKHTASAQLPIACSTVKHTASAQLPIACSTVKHTASAQLPVTCSTVKHTASNGKLGEGL